MGLFLCLFSLPWDWFCRFRRFLYNYAFLPKRQFQVPIISVGNLVFGGTGKTPLVLWIGQYLNSKNKKVMILTRGYKSKLENSFGILKSNNMLGFNSFYYGDEALLLSNRLKNASVVVGKKRADNLQFYFAQEMPDVVLLDDGHQHIQLARKLNILLFDASMPLNRYRVAPRGYLREGMSAIKDADLLILNHRSNTIDAGRVKKLKEFLNSYTDSSIPFAEIKYRTLGFFDSSGQMKFTPKEIEGRKVVCLAGIASPQSFFDLVESLGAEIVHKIPLPDHHFFSIEECKKYLDLVDENDAILLITEKDMVKIKRIIDNEKVVYLAVQVKFLSGEEKVKASIDRAAFF